eukprot:1900-Heterococcus_DN1.PRE.2
MSRWLTDTPPSVSALSAEPTAIRAALCIMMFIVRLYAHALKQCMKRHNDRSVRMLHDVIDDAILMSAVSVLYTLIHSAG